MKVKGRVKYEVEDVFGVFIKNAKRDFENFSKENPLGCKIEKEITTGGPKPIKCTVEITGYELNKKYEITTSNEYSKCVSTYTFEEKKDGSTELTLNEYQSTGKMLQYASLWLQRIIAKKRFKQSFKAIIEALENELRKKNENMERCKQKAR